MKREELISKFAEIYGSGGEILTFFAPGRVNLIGEHTDYNGGHVFPCALTIGTYGAVRKRTDDVMRFYSLNFPQRGILESSINHVVNTRESGWSNYPKGVVWAMAERGMILPSGFEMLLYGNIPNGSGLSSSASVELLTGVALRGLFGFSVENLELAKIGQYSENHFNKVNCGIMDQFAIAMGKKDHAMFLDTSDLSYTYAPLKLDGARIVIASSNKKRGLGDSKYNERRRECETALAQIQKAAAGASFGENDSEGKAVSFQEGFSRKTKIIPSLGALTPEEFEEIAGVLTDPVIRRRAKHAVYENARTIEAVAALQRKDVLTFGRLMNESHISLRDDYEVTGIELDTLVESAWKQEGVIGSRMTGAGFGGCTVSIVREEFIDRFIRNVGEEYQKTIGYAADFYVVDIGDGAGAY